MFNGILQNYIDLESNLLIFINKKKGKLHPKSFTDSCSKCNMFYICIVSIKYRF